MSGLHCQGLGCVWLCPESTDSVMLALALVLFVETELSAWTALEDALVGLFPSCVLR